MRNRGETADLRRLRRGLAFASGDDMECWIGVAHRGDRRLVQLAGRLSIAQVPELLATCKLVLPQEIDLGELISADADGIEVLRQLRARGLVLVGASGYMQLKLDSGDTAPTPLFGESLPWRLDR